MISVLDIIKYFNKKLTDEAFQTFLKANFPDITAYNILEGDYIVSNKKGIELGFSNEEAVYDDDTEIVFEPGDPVFSHFNLFPKSETFMSHLPYGVTFNDSRKMIQNKAGKPFDTKQGHLKILNQDFLVDIYHQDNYELSFDYQKDGTAINHIQFRRPKKLMRYFLYSEHTTLVSSNTSDRIEMVQKNYYFACVTNLNNSISNSCTA